MYDDVKEMPAPYDTNPLDTTPTTYSIPDLDLVQLQEHFQQLQERLNQLGPTTNPSTHGEELAHLTKKLQQLAVTLQPCTTCRPMDEPIYTAVH